MTSTSRSFIYLLKHTELAVRGCVEVALQQFALTPNQFLMLLRVSYEEGSSATQLARAIGVRPQSLTEIIGPLVAKRLVRRSESAKHRRVLQTSLTPAGRRLLDRALRIGRQLEDDLLADLTVEERAALFRALEKTLERARWHECHPEVRRGAAVELMKTEIARAWSGGTRRRRLPA
jgi:DNA-binding MarR family transcriptional regulator